MHSLADAVKTGRRALKEARAGRYLASELGLQIAATALAWSRVRVDAGGLQVGMP
jgi:hypothetical protein